LIIKLTYDSLTEITGTIHTVLEDESSQFLSEGDDLTRGVTREELDTLKQTAASAINDSLLKKLQEINQAR